MEAVSLKTSPIQSNRGFTAVQDEMPGDGEEDDLMYQGRPHIWVGGFARVCRSVAHVQVRSVFGWDEAYMPYLQE